VISPDAGVESPKRGEIIKPGASAPGTGEPE
jgi:hypothetical protein